MEFFIWTLGVFVAALWLLLKPERAQPEKASLLSHINFAHRGLHTKDKAVPENSIAAFRAAADAGYGIELDVQLTLDEEVVVFHDDTLVRVTGAEGRVETHTLAQLRALHLCGTREGIPLFTEMLAAADGRVPLIVELKTGKRNTLLCQKTYDILQQYSGPYCVESFDPRIVRWFKQNAPEVLRGQLSQAPSAFVKSGESKILSFALGCLLTNVLARPHFIAYGIGKKPWTVLLSELLGAKRVAWTARPENNIAALEASNDGVIFEFYTPKPHF